MSLRLALSLVAVGLGVAQAAPAWAQRARPAPAKDPAEDSEAAAKPAPAEGQPAPVPEGPPPDLDGTAENPEAPLDSEEPPPITAPVVKAAPVGYPMQEVARPLTLLRFQTEVALESRNVGSPFVNAFTLRGRFGVTPKVQVSLAYNIGGIYDDGRGTTFNTGKALSVGATVKILPWMAAAVSFPIYLDPFAASITLGVPMRFRFSERFSATLAEDVIDARLYEFVPSIVDEAANEVQAGRVGTNTTRNLGNLRFGGAGVYQHRPNLAFLARLAVSFIDFKSADIGYLLKAGAQYSIRPNIDVSALVGFDDLEDSDKTFGATLGVAVRI